jgi:hypothetical protein
MKFSTRMRVRFHNRICGSHTGGYEMTETRNLRETPAQAPLTTCFHAGFLLGSFFDPEYGGDMFFRNIGSLSTDYMALYPRRHNFSRYRWSVVLTSKSCYIFADHHMVSSLGLLSLRKQFPHCKKKQVPRTVEQTVVDNTRTLT